MFHPLAQAHLQFLRNKTQSPTIKAVCGSEDYWGFRLGQKFKSDGFEYLVNWMYSRFLDDVTRNGGTM
jgi:hypothetical protein